MAGVAGLNSSNEINGCDALTGQNEPAKAAGNPADCRTSRPRRPEGFTYFVQAGAQIKIGFTNNFNHRLNSLKSVVKKPLTVLAVVPSDMAPEYDVHQLFAGLRIRGEWFRADRGLLDFIDGLTADLEAQKVAPTKPVPERLSVYETIARDLQAAIHTMPKVARHFAYNIIQQAKTLSGDCEPERAQALQRGMKQQTALLERAMRDVQ